MTMLNGVNGSLHCPTNEPPLLVRRGPRPNDGRTQLDRFVGVMRMYPKDGDLYVVEVTLTRKQKKRWMTFLAFSDDAHYVYTFEGNDLVTYSVPTLPPLPKKLEVKVEGNQRIRSPLNGFKMKDTPNGGLQIIWHTLRSRLDPLLEDKENT
jgi:hypothetical protein